MSKSFSFTKISDDRYDKLTPLEHILHRPDTYVGSISKNMSECWILDKTGKQITKEQITIVPAACKVVDEILVNARDHSIRDTTVNRIKITLDTKDNTICVWNNGNGIEIAKHSVHGEYYPFMIFGQLNTSDNFDDKEAKIVGGRNGLGAKLTNIFSCMFQVETVDAEKQLKWKQTFENNMTKIGKPKITKFSGKPYTKITFLLDFERLGMTGLEHDFCKYIERRAWDLAGCTDGRVNIYFNSTRCIPIKRFEKYVDMYIGNKLVTKRAYCELTNDHMETQNLSITWQVAACASHFGFKQVSFVNGIATTDGGKHVEYIRKKIINALKKKIDASKKYQDMNQSSRWWFNVIQNHLWLFINAVVVNPDFSSQTKEKLTTNSKNFGFKCTIPEEFLVQLEKQCEITKLATSFAQFKTRPDISTTDGRKTSKISGIDNLVDAEFAGTRKSSKCTLVITEGLSAKTFAVSGFKIVEHGYWGVWPIRGKFLNVGQATKEQLLKNKEYNDFKKIMGLQEGVEYTSTKNLRYGKIMLLADQDYDGSHIKGLLMNMISKQWPSLLKLDGFLSCFMTPLIIAKRQKQKKEFFNLQDFYVWREQNPGWKAEYFKGLGTSTPAEAKSYWRRKENYIRAYYCQSFDQTLKMFEHAFGKDPTYRKKWLMNYDRNAMIDYSQKQTSFEEFFAKEYVHYIKYDTERSICNIIDGLKTSQRKILWVCRSIDGKLLKVEQLAGKVSELSDYHHGEKSLKDAIVGMAQIFVGSNSLNLLYPKGQFGSRVLKGKDASQPRYIFTKLSGIVETLFPKVDDPLLNYLRDDNNKTIEPQFFVPIIPLVLVNGCNGVGNGFSTTIINYNPKDIIANVVRLLDGKQIQTMTPYFNGFDGSITTIGKQSYTFKGVWDRLDDCTIQVTELPVGVPKDCLSFEKFQQFLECSIINEREKDKKKRRKQFIKEYISKGDDSKCEYIITWPSKESLDKLINSGELEKKLKLINTFTVTNMNGFDRNDVMQKFDNVEQIFKYFFDIRLEFYKKRKEMQIEDWQGRILKASCKQRFLQLYLNGNIQLHKKTDEQVVAQLKAYKLPQIDNKYSYLLTMPINQLTETQMNKLQGQITTLEQELQTIINTDVRTTWKQELQNLSDAIDKLYNENKRILEENKDENDQKPKRKKRKRV